MSRLAVLALITASLCCPTALGQSIPEGTTAFEHGGDWTAASQTAVFSDTSTLDLDGTLLPDLVLKVGVSIAVMHDVGKIIARSTPVSSCWDFDVIPAFGSQPPSIVYVDADGLHTTSIVDGPPRAWQSTPLLLTPLGSGSLVQVADIDHDGDMDVVGFNATLNAFHTFIWNGSSYVLFGSPLTVPVAVEAFELFDRVGNGSALLELAAASADSFTVLTLGGSVTATRGGPQYTTDDLCIVRHGDTDAEWAAWLYTQDAGTTNEVQRIAFGQSTIGTGYTVPAAAKAAKLDAGDMTGDGRDDIVLNIAETFEVGLATNTGTTSPSLSMSTDMRIDPIPHHSNDPADANPLNGAVPNIAADLDSDGDKDVALPYEIDNLVATPKDIYIRRSGLIDETTMQPTLTGPNGPELELHGHSADTSDLVIHVAAPATMPTAPGGSLPYIELTCWKQDTINDTIPSAPHSGPHYLPLVAGTPSYTFTIDLGEYGTTFDSIWFWTQRIVSADDDTEGTILAVHPASNHAFASYLVGTPEGDALAAYLVEIQTGPPIPVTITPIFTGGGGTGGGGLPLECIGPHDDDDIPRPPTGTGGTTGGGG